MMQLTSIKPFTSTGVLRNYAGNIAKFLIHPDQSNDALAIVEMTILQGNEPPCHVHTLEDEIFLIHEGELQVWIGEELFIAKPGMSVFLPRGIKHEFKVLTPSARFTLILTPGKFAKHFWDNSFDVDKYAKPQAPQGPPPAELIEKWIIELSTYGVSFV